ncbi:DUF421 domain-containing protein [Halalkalibacter okhensis]|uniref:DUF421 domain-containing protein n=1 Tax=Halalkalibacter okhensis TaxID=333138 RepID=A0A0B0IQL5_9BACI|nr:DUF421 domain-containing protein [Halalkalibacter okhensis]KHF41956.1 hypothetical protein LQ50_01315 [Halalkalibacter okhensis]
MNELFIVFVRTIGAFSFLLVLNHLLGKQSLSQMTNHDFITAVMMGAISANVAFNTQLNFKDIVLSLILVSAIGYITSFLSLKNHIFRKVFSGEPTVIIENGKILEEHMKKQKYTLDALNQGLRQKGIFDINEVKYAVLEVNGQLSVQKKSELLPLTQKSFYKHSTDEIRNFPVELIMDGTIKKKNLEDLGLDAETLKDMLFKKGVHPSTVFYCVLGTNGQLAIDLYNDSIKNPIDSE